MIPVIGIRRLRMGLDGEGVRTLIGTLGCPLRCHYCLNPQAWNGEAQVTAYTPEALYEQVKLDDLYFRATGGGLTFGGGEPLLHIRAIARLVSLCPAAWSMWMETSLCGTGEQITEAARVIDHFLVDLKTADPEIYRSYTGGDGTIALNNLKLLLELVGPERITLRLPLIPGFAGETSRQASAEAAKKLGIRNFDYLTYCIPEKEVL